MSQVKRLTPDGPFPEYEVGKRSHFKYGTPWPLSEDFFLANPLNQVLNDSVHAPVLPEAVRLALVIWVDCNVPQYGSYVRTAAQQQGKLVWPTLDVDSANVLGVAGRGVPLGKNFWHENASVAGSHVFLGSSHTRNQVFIMDRQEKLLWEYDIPHPQDVWMLPNGNILVAYLRGVREVTREKQVVWDIPWKLPVRSRPASPCPMATCLSGWWAFASFWRLTGGGRASNLPPPSGNHMRSSACAARHPRAPASCPSQRKAPCANTIAMAVASANFPLSSHQFVRCGLRMATLSSLRRKASGNFLPMDSLSGSSCPIMSPPSIFTLAGVQRFPNGQTVVCNWGTRASDGRAAVHIFAVDEEKRAVWKVKSPLLGQVAQCQLLAPDATPRSDDIAR